MPAYPARLEYLGHQRIDQTASAKLGYRRHRLDDPRAVERVESTGPHRRRSLRRGFLIRTAPTELLLDVSHCVGQNLPSTGARIKSAQRSRRTAVVLGNDETRVVAQGDRLGECEAAQIVEAVVLRTAGNQVPDSTTQMTSRREHHHVREKGCVFFFSGPNLKAHDSRSNSRDAPVALFHI